MVGFKLSPVLLFCLSLGALCYSKGLPEENTDLLRRLLKELEKEENERFFLHSSMEDSEDTSHEDDPIKEEEKLEEKTSHGGDLIDKVNINQDSTLAKMIEGMKVGQNGILKEPKGMHPESDKKERADSLDRHMYPPGYKGVGNKASKKNFASNLDILWPGGIVPYTIATSLSSTKNNTKIIEKAIEEINNKTCIRFVPQNSTEAQGLSHSSYIEFFSGSGCWSYVGRVYDGKQQISLENGDCVNPNTVQHEILHAIGMEHEQSRSDRDSYISIINDNIEDENLPQFDKYNTIDTRPYDYESVLQYDLYSFAKLDANNKKLKSMELKDHLLDFLANSDDGLDFYDVADITDTYKCTAHCSYKPACVHGGFVDQYCKCYCPDGLKGDLCQYVDLQGNVGGIVDVSSGDKVIYSPNYPSSYPLGTNIVWLIKAPVGYTVQIHITDLDLSRNNQEQRCYHWLEIRYNLIGQLGPKICGQIKNQTWTATSHGNPNLMLLKFDTTFVQDRLASKGFMIVASATKGDTTAPVTTTTPTSTSTKPTTTPSTQPPSSESGESYESADEIRCGFEPGETCPFNLHAGSVDWTVHSGSTPTYWTGPNHAYKGDWYAYLEASGIKRHAYAAMVYDVTSDEAYEEHCLSFAYHMRGRGMGYLAVYMYTDEYKNLWVDGGHNLGNYWYTADVTIPASHHSFEIDITAFKGRNLMSDIAIDDIVLSHGKCDDDHDDM